MSLEMSVLSEIANIGAGHAATALSRLFHGRVHMDPPEVFAVDLDGAVAALGDDADDVTAALLRVEGGLAGLVVVITTDHAEMLEALGVPEMPAPDVMAEAGNIVTAKLAEAIGMMTGLDGQPLPPAAGQAGRSTLVASILSMTADVEPITFARSHLSLGTRVSVDLLFVPDATTVSAFETMA